MGNDNDKRYLDREMLPQKIDIVQLAGAISTYLNQNVPASQVQRAVQRYNLSFSPYFRTITKVFTAVSQVSEQLTLNFDASYGFFCTGIAGIQSSTDTDAFVNQVQTNDGANFFREPFPFPLLTRYTGIPLEFGIYMPPITQVQTIIVNGSITASARLTISFLGYKLPEIFIKQFAGKTQANP